MSDNKLRLKQLFFGKTDAYNELLECGSEQFERSFLKYDAYSIDEFLKGLKYYIYGDKGTGKTAFLKYLECVLSDSSENLVIPIRYKSEFDADDRKGLQKTALDNVQEEIADTVGLSEQKDCIVSWQLYLISRIMKGFSVKKGEYRIFADNKDYETLCKLLHCIYSDESHRIVPKISKGLVNVNLSVLSGISAAVELEIELEKDQRRVNYQKLAKKIVDLFGTLNLDSSQNNNIWILFDELELSVQSPKMNKRDIQLVRDLVLAIERLNDLCRTKAYPIHIIASIRSEVINSVYTSGFEINKAIEDFGQEICWYVRGGNYESSPLISMILNKLKVCEETLGIEDDSDLWKKYFPNTINNMSSKEYILRYTWHRPRDIIRILNIAKDNAGNSTCFTQEIFDASIRIYSQKSWNEIAEELSLIYDADDLRAIKKLLSNIGVPFTLNDLSERLRNLGTIYDYVDRFNNRHKLIDVLEQLFASGVIGNSGQRMRFKFLKDDELDPLGNMIIHTPLRNYFAVQSSNRN